MPRTRLGVAVVSVIAVVATTFYTSLALAQPFKVEADAANTGVTDAAPREAPSPADAAVPAPVWPRAPEPSATTSSSSGPRPDPGPGLRERGGRTRRSNPAGGVLLVFVIVGALGYYVMKRIRRH